MLSMVRAETRIDVDCNATVDQIWQRVIHKERKMWSFSFHEELHEIKASDRFEKFLEDLHDALGLDQYPAQLERPSKPQPSIEEFNRLQEMTSIQVSP